MKIKPTQNTAGEFELSDPPEGITLRTTSPKNEDRALVLQADGAKMKPGRQGNLIVNVFAGRNPAAAGKQQAAPRRRLVGTLPAMPFENVRESLSLVE